MTTTGSFSPGPTGVVLLRSTGSTSPRWHRQAGLLLGRSSTCISIPSYVLLLSSMLSTFVRSGWGLRSVLIGLMTLMSLCGLMRILTGIFSASLLADSRGWGGPPTLS